VPAFAGAGVAADGLVQDAERVDDGGRGESVVVVGGDDLGDLLAVVGEGAAQIASGGEVAGLAFALGQSVSA
jgi:hypothetical protein